MIAIANLSCYSTFGALSPCFCIEWHTDALVEILRATGDQTTTDRKAPVTIWFIMDQHKRKNKIYYKVIDGFVTYAANWILTGKQTASQCHPIQPEVYSNGFFICLFYVSMYNTYVCVCECVYDLHWGCHRYRCTLDSATLLQPSGQRSYSFSLDVSRINGASSFLWFFLIFEFRFVWFVKGREFTVIDMAITIDY